MQEIPLPWTMRRSTGFACRGVRSRQTGAGLLARSTHGYGSIEHAVWRLLKGSTFDVRRRPEVGSFVPCSDMSRSISTVNGARLRTRISIHLSTSICLVRRQMSMRMDG